jgi:DNA-binding LytR/AlgR family response regulator
MRIVIIEDERLTAEDLSDTVLSIKPDAEIVTLLFSVKEAVNYFQINDKPDLIFSDIQLGDGLSFEIFKTIQINTPVIFCTAYDEYALTAFKANGIDYILKPFTRNALENALNKYTELKRNFSKDLQGYEEIARLFENRNKSTATSVLVYVKDKIVPVSLKSHDL